MSPPEEQMEMASAPASNPPNTYRMRQRAMAAVQKAQHWAWQLIPSFIGAVIAILLVAIPFGARLDRRLAVIEATSVSQSDFQDLRNRVSLLQQTVETLRGGNP